MRTSRRLAAVTLGAAFALTPWTAIAQDGHVPDRTGDAVQSVDVTEVKVIHGQHRIKAVVTIPGLKPGRLSGTEVLIKTPGKKKVYAVTVLRNRRGKAVERSLQWRPLSDPVEPTILPCKGIRTSLSPQATTVSVPKTCLTRTGPTQQIRAKVRTVDGTIGLEGAYFDEQTRHTPYLEVGK